MSNRFPIELLAQPTEARWAYFVAKIVAHPRLIEAHQKLKQAIRYATQGRLILIYGPTGVGKTTLRQGIERELLDEAWPDLEEDPSRIPILGLEAVPPELGQFDWIDFYTRALMALNEPLIPYKLADDELDYDVPGIRRSERGRLVIQSGVKTRALRRAMENALQYRRPAAFIIDEAQHLQKVAGGRRLQDQMDAIKSLANRSNTAHVLIGTYELLNLTNLSDQLSRRSYHISFPRYRADCETDIQTFKEVLQTFQQHLPLNREPDLTGQWDYFYEHSAGCVGILKSWLCDALADALENKQQTLTDKYLNRHKMSSDRLLNVAHEIIEGEKKLAELESQPAQARQILGLESQLLPKELTPDAQATQSKPKKGRIGTRQPTRDPIGRNKNGH